MLVVITRFWQVPDQTYSEELDPVVTRQKLTRIGHYPDHRFKSTRKRMIRAINNIIIFI